MKRRVTRLVAIAECLQFSVCPDIGREQSGQLGAMSAELDAMQVTCVDRMLLRQPPSPLSVCTHSLCSASSSSIARGVKGQQLGGSGRNGDDNDKNGDDMGTSDI